jgi:hypothetical protein
MREYQNKTTVQKFLTKKICNKCGNALDPEKYELEEWMMDFIHSIEIYFGYGSGFDTEHWSFDLCEKCLVEFTSSFMIPKTVERFPLL